MTDTTQLGAPVGTGDVIATDDLGATGKVQWVKLMDGTNNGTGTIPGDATNGLRVDVNNVAVADGGALPAKGVQVGGTDGSVFQVLSTDAAGRLNTNINGTVPVSGTVTADTELPAAAALGDATANPTTSVIEAMLGCYNGTTWDRVRGDTTNGIFVNVKTQTPPASLPLPAGAATAAKQPALGTAGTPSADVLTVQGVTSMTALKTDGSGVTQPVSGTVTANLGTANVTNAGTFAVQADTELPAAAALADGAANPTTPMVGSAGLVWNGATWDRLKGDTTNGAFVNVKTSVLPTGASTSAKQPALGTAGAASADVVSVQGIASMTALKVDPSAVTSPVSLASLPALATGSNLIGRVNVEPETTGGLTIFHLVSAATTNATNIKASAGQVYGWYIYNSNAAARKLAFHNTAGTPTAGASIAFAIVIPPTSGANVHFTSGIAFATGIAITTVTDLTDAGATAVALNDLIINVFYK